MAMRRAGTFLLLLIAFGFVPVSGQADGDPENWCRAGAFTRFEGQFQVATVKGKRGTRVSFYNDFEPECPTESCREKSYLVPGDKVVISNEYKGFVCSWYAPAKGIPTVGWVKAAEVQVERPSTAVPLSSWLGTWTYAENTIRFTNNKLRGWLNVTGEAFWQGLGDNIHIGELDDRVEPKKNLAEVGARDPDEYACKATIRKVGQFLVVRDNLNCGGANVTFSGVYRKK